MVEQLKKTKPNIVKGESGLFWQFFLTALKIHKIHKTLKCQRNNTSPVHLKNPQTSFFHTPDQTYYCMSLKFQLFELAHERVAETEQ